MSYRWEQANMDTLVNAENAARREVWRQKVSNMREELRALTGAYDKEARRLLLHARTHARTHTHTHTQSK
jgi:hypothetical protein